MNGDIYALVGTVGGAGTTRLALEFAGVLARDGADIAVVDAAFGTQGLISATPGRLDADVTEVVTDDRSLEAAMVQLSLETPGRVTVAPARAPFERLARAKTSECARRLAERLSAAADRFDAVIVDVPPVAANQAVAAVTAADRVVPVAPASERGEVSLSRTRDRLADVDAGVDATVANYAAPDDPLVSTADAAVPEGEMTALHEAPAAVADDEFAVAVGAAVEAVTGVEPDLPEPESSLTDYLPR